MTTLTEEFAEYIKHITGELTDHERDDDGIEMLIEKFAFPLLPKVEAISIHEYMDLMDARSAAIDLSDELKDAVDDLLLGCAVVLAGTAVMVHKRACAAVPLDKEAVDAAQDILTVITDDSGEFAQYAVVLTMDQELDFRGHDEILGDNPQYVMLAERFAANRAAGKTTRHLDPSEPASEYVAPQPQPEPQPQQAPTTKTSVVKGFLSALSRKAG